MSENLKKLREAPEAELRRRERRSQKIIWKARYEPIAGMSQIEELERKAEEARKEEQRVKEELEETEKELRKSLVNKLYKVLKTLEILQVAPQLYKDIATDLEIMKLSSDAERFRLAAREAEEHNRMFREALDKFGVLPEKYKKYRK